MAKADEIEIRSQEVQEILGTPPGWMTRWGSLLALIIVVILGWIGFYFRYPEKVESRIAVSITDPPKRLVTENQGRIALIRVENETNVDAGEVLVVLETQAQFGDVMSLETMLMQMPNPSDSMLLNFSVPEEYMLGELKDNLFDFYSKRDAYRYLLSNPYDEYSIGQLRNEYRKVQSMIRADRGRWDNIDRQIDMVQDRLRREEQLARENLLADERVERTRESLLSLQRIRESIEASIRNKELEQERIKTQQSGVRADSKDEVQKAAIQMRESFASLKRSISDWMRRYVIVSPIQGMVSFNQDAISEQQFVEAGREIGVVVPMDNKELRGNISLTVSQATRVREGQKVVVRFDSYPYPEFGAVMGTVDRKSQVPVNGIITARVSFPQGLVTTFNRKIELARQMEGDAIIVLQDKRFLERVFEGVRSTIAQEG
jgi:multidrug resistance efflux pump